jgi:signal transduction histidine kinase
MLLEGLNQRLATTIRLASLVLIGWSVAGSRHHPAASGRGLVITSCLVVCVVCWLAWTADPDGARQASMLELYGMSLGGGVLVGATPGSAASAFVFVAVALAAIRAELSRALPILAAGVAGIGISVLIYKGSGLGLLAYTLGFAGVALAGSNRREARIRAEQTELLLAQTQRTHEEQLRAARLEESSRIARDIHDVLAHTLAGLTIQLEATTSLLEQGADRDSIVTRLRHARALAGEGLQETRRAVGALRGEPVSAPASIEALVADYRETVGAPAKLTIDGDQTRLTGPTGEAVLRVTQEALTNVRKHAPGAGVSVVVQAGSEPRDEIVLRVEDRPHGSTARPADGLAGSGGGYGLQGMRERARLLGGTLSAGSVEGGWRVELRLPAAAVEGEQ